MGATGDPDVERIGSASVDVEMVRFIRQEIKAAVQEEITATASAPPSYDSSSRLLADDGSAEDGDTEALGVSDNQDSPRPVTWLRATAIAFPIAATVVGPLAASISGWDKLELSILGFFLVLTMYGSIPVIFLFTYCFMPKVPQAESNTGSKPDKELAANDFFGAYLGMAWHFCLMSIIFALIVLSWLASRPDSILSRYKVANDFDAKIGAQDALAKLTRCLYNSIPDRNATISDLTACLKDMGVTDIQ